MAKLCMSLLVGIAAVFAGIPAHSFNKGVIYATADGGSGVGDYLYTIDTPGQVTKLGQFIFDFPASGGVTEIAFSGDTLYGAVYRGAYNVIINPETAEVQRSNLPISGYSGALTGDFDGILYELNGSNYLSRINPADETTTLIGDTGIGDTRVRFTEGDLAIGPDGTLYGVAVKLLWPEGYNIGFPEYDGSWLYKFDKSTGVATPIGDTGYGRSSQDYHI